MKTRVLNGIWIGALSGALLGSLAGSAAAQNTPAVTIPEGVTVPEGMVYVPAGEFTMGSDERDGSDFNQRDNVPLNKNDARPKHKVTTPAFFIDKTEVTNADYKKFLDATGYPAPPSWKDGQFSQDQASFPVIQVSFYDAQAYARWAGKRLPTEIEWEKAARGTDARIYAWGNDWNGNKGNVESGGLKPVGSFSEHASPYGALDMSGNAWEWTATWFDAYPNAPTQQPDFGQRTIKVIRGGSWTGGNDLATTWYRGVMRPRARTQWTGFRCVLDAPK